MTHTIIKQIEDRIATILRAGMIPWRTPWIDDPNCGFPRHAMTGSLYSCANPMLLVSASNYHRFASKWWGTQSDWESLGGRVHPCANPTLIICYTPEIATLNVFNLDQVEGDVFDKYRPLTTEATRDDQADWSCLDRIIEAGQIDVRTESRNGGLYTYPTLDGGGDFISMPHEFLAFDDVHWKFTMLHEFGHYCEPRFKWPSERDKAQDELIAEMTAGYAAMLLNVPSDLCDHNHNLQLEKWLARAKARPGYFFESARQAFKAANYLVGLAQRGREDKETRAARTETARRQGIILPR